MLGIEADGCLTIFDGEVCSFDGGIPHFRNRFAGRPNGTRSICPDLWRRERLIRTQNHAGILAGVEVFDLAVFQSRVDFIATDALMGIAADLLDLDIPP